ncbi:MAG: DUF1329 domain-containing protein [Chitinispirillaceae bacterium]|nr:DUF1329 domain-containing protein [Chitinispirillaceae bacterium]
MILHKSVIVAALIICFSLISLSSRATEIKLSGFKSFNEATYDEEELKVVREWENKWAGKRIDASNIDEVKEFTPPAMYEIYKNKEKWGDTWFKIIPYQPCDPSKGLIEAVKQYGGQATLGSKGELLNWTAGHPFPDPKSALEICYNFRNLTYSDSYEGISDGWLTDGRLKYDTMKSVMEGYFSYFTGRLDTPPVPRVEQNPKDIWYTYVSTQIEPAFGRNTQFFEVKYNDRLKPYDAWIWSPQARRVIRRNTTMRQDATSGGDVTAYDNWGWDGAILENDYKFLGIKEVLIPRHVKEGEVIHVPGNCVLQGLPRERVKCYVIEATNKDPFFIYSKMYWYIDVETYAMSYSERFDRQGRLWKIVKYAVTEDKGYDGAKIYRPFLGGAIDLQQTHSTMMFASGKYGITLKPSIFTLNYIQQRGY